MSPPTVQDVAKAIPSCPNCGCDRYRSLTENAAAGFRLKGLTCEKCQFDILRAFEQSDASRPSPMKAAVWSIVLCFLIVSEVVLIAAQVIE